ncbi:lysine exporter LysO family protein [Acinetobacter sichuanensis]|uniref:Lysine exporter LysO family protein n=1 Tax=Acinetobacter sichuanensis TaxID=2136183 RepID=A0A371YL16_9GAMM|nr:MULTISPECIES: lysine exporter LysO family protein [Acinetobacter]MDM1247498.1 lysine exporter LysO family protein [Acinetobacter sp. R933-2]MDM1763263.1 lysine exporter LysO family protein [Acinetobacter sp. 226-1]MDM1766742.1 lysine exporter LysO family protein [Acinetobacter sp. 226-4]MDQ9020282.1 lysine exporter LysO family protein [Acinetobacter sichuanensis]RFC82167.1 lysine exporter LysO family protein [Acinetobacter sichuanensis]
MQSLWLIFQLLFCLFLGFILARRLPQWLEKIAFKVLPYFTYILLVAIAIEFAQTLHTIAQPAQILSDAITISLATSAGAFICCYILFKLIGFQPTQGRVSSELLIGSLINISYAFIAIAFGYGLSELFSAFDYQLHISSWYLLLIFMILIGLDLAYSPLDRSWLNWKIMLVPIGCIIGSIIGAVVCSLLINNINLKDLIMLSQGYGFYSMTGIVVTELKNAHLGSIALMNDLFREIFAILAMYIIGWRYPRSAISTAGATAMDVTLPMVKQACGNEFIPHAMVSGFVLSILAPIAVSILAAL